MTNARERVGEDSEEDDVRHKKGLPLIESGKVVGEGLDKY